MDDDDGGGGDGGDADDGLGGCDGLKVATLLPRSVNVAHFLWRSALNPDPRLTLDEDLRPVSWRPTVFTVQPSFHHRHSTNQVS